MSAEMQLRNDFKSAESTAHLQTERAKLESIEVSRAEARTKEQRYLDFISNPFDEDRPWWNALFAYDYFKLFVKESEYRKDGFTQESLHVLTPLLRMKGQLTGPKSPEDIILPRFINYEVANYKSVITGQENPVIIKLPQSMRSIERFFVAETVHDLCENYPGATTDGFRAYMRNRIESNAPKDLRPLLMAEVEEDCRALDALTFGKRIYEPNGTIRKKTTHNEDLNAYRQAMESVLAAIAVKGPDRTDGLETRFSRLQIFSPKKNKDYLDETNALFLHPRPLEAMMTRYPELANYFEISNAKMDVAYRAFHVFVEYNPDLVRDSRKQGRAETAEVNLDKSPLIAARDFPYLDADLHPWPKMLRNLRYEVERHPVLQPLYDQIETQLRPYLTPPFKPVRQNNILLRSGGQSERNSSIWTAPSHF